MQKKKNLLPGNKILSNPGLLKGICIVISLLLFLLFNAAVQTLIHLKELFSSAPRSWSYLDFDFKHFGRLYIFAIILCSTVGVVFYHKILLSFKDLNVGQKGAARFQTFEETRKIYKEIPAKDKPFPGVGGLPVSRYADKLYIDDRINNNFIVAVTRGGKGELFVIPSLDIYSRAEIQSSVIVNDLKDGELSRAAIPPLSKRNYNIRIFDVTDSKHSNCINILDLATDYYLAGEVAWAEQACYKIAYSLYQNEGMQTDQFWVKAPIALFTAVAMAHIIDCSKIDRTKINMYSITLFISVLSSITDPKKKENELDKFFMSRSIHDPARLSYSTIKFSEGKTRGSILAIVFSALGIFLHQNIIDITSSTDIDLEGIGFNPDRPTALFIRQPQNNAVYHPLVSIIYSQIHFALTNKATRENKGECLRPVKNICDEIFSGAPIENLSGILSTCLSAKISYDFYAQSDQQVEDVYGKKGKIILDNCSTKIFIATDSLDTTKMFSDRLGNKTVKNVSRSGSRFSLSKSITESYDTMPLLSVEELSKLEEGEVVVLQTIKRRSLQGERVVSLPIFCHDETKLLYRYEYLPEFDPKQDIDYSVLSLKPRHIDKENLVYLPGVKKSGTQDYWGDQKSETVSSPMLLDVFSPQKTQIIKNILSEYHIDLDFDGITVNALKEILKELRITGKLSEADYQILQGQLLQKGGR